tara:strand:- start:2202 stop:2420 length:219 start_codon:yes stop_codon:yes gene_type:complete
MAKTPVKKKKPAEKKKVWSILGRKPAEKKKGRSILGRIIRGEKVLYDMKKRKLILEPENKKKPVKKPVKKAK